MDLLLQKHSWLLSGLALVLGAYLAARTANALITTALASRPFLQQSNASTTIGDRAQPVELDAEKAARLFDVPLPKAAPDDADPSRKSGGNGEWNEIPIRSSVHALLIGTAIADPARYSLCQITSPDLNETQVYVLGDEYQGARIYGIEKARVLLDRKGVNEYIDDNGPRPPGPGMRQEREGVRQLSERHYAVPRDELNRWLSNLPEATTQARIVPSFRNGVATGFRLFSIVPESLYAKLGIQNGDVIRRINGYEMNSPDRALEIYQKLRDASRIEIDLERRGESLRNSYSIE